jgi:glycosyltransferase involved in cell wall biosynthesis
MKICVIAGRYGISGVPLAQYRLAKALAKLGHNVELVFGSINVGCKIPSSGKFKILTLNKNRVLLMFFNLIKIVKYKNFDLIFSAGDHLNAVVLFAAIISRSSIKICCSSRVTPYDTYPDKKFSKGWFLKIIMKLVMYRANVLSCVSKDMVAQYKNIFKNSKHVPIYNIIKDSESEIKIKENVDEDWLANKKTPVIIAAGMLEPWKGFADLICAFNKLLNRKKAKLIILGDGSLRGYLEKKIKSLGINEHVKLKGNVKNPLKYFSRADVFALTSHVEGMPNVLIEAMMAGCTPVSTDCETGPRELLVNGKYGYLVKVNDIESISRGLLEALENPIKKNILDEAVELFSEEKIIESYSRYLNINFNSK